MSKKILYDWGRKELKRIEIFTGDPDDKKRLLIKKLKDASDAKHNKELKWKRPRSF